MIKKQTHTKNIYSDQSIKKNRKKGTLSQDHNIINYAQKPIISDPETKNKKIQYSLKRVYLYKTQKSRIKIGSREGKKKPFLFF